MFISTITLFVVAWAAYAIWSKLCDIEQKLFRMHTELSLSQKDTETQIDLLQSAVGRIEHGSDFDLDRPPH